MRRGQLEAGFQWVYVLIAGGAMLVFFFLVARGCAQSGTERAEGISTAAAASRLQAGVWQPESVSGLTVQPLDAACIGGVITLTGEYASSPVERAAVFLPPSLQGEDALLSRPFTITRQGSPEIPLGSALYVFDEHTYYVLLDGGAFEAPTVTLEEVPRGARNVILIARTGRGHVTNADVTGLPAGANVRGVSIDGDTAEFFSREDGAMVSLGTAPAEHDLLRTGAMASGDPGLYRCARQHLLDRARTLTRIYAGRAHALAYDLPLCAPQLNAAAGMLDAINGNPEYLAALVAKERELAQAQNALLLKSCPVIA